MNPSPEGTTPAFSVFPLRFTDDPPAMIAFLRTLGMVPVVTVEGDGFGELIAGGGGRVMVHATSSAETASVSGETHLCLSVPSVEDAAEPLRRRGLEVRVWDETYGKQGLVQGPRGEAVSLNEHQRDLYGYRGHDADEGGGPDARLQVTAVRASAAGTERETDIEFFAEFGFAPTSAGDQWWQELSAPHAGGVGLHAPVPGKPASRPSDTEFGDVALVRLGFSTAEDLDALAERLRGAGYPARRVDEHRLRAVHVTDPDGQQLEIHGAPSR